MTTLNQPIQINCDNESAIKLSGNPVFHVCSKHIETHYHFVQEKVLLQDVELHKIYTNEQVPNIFTKALAYVKFEVFRKAFVFIENKLEAVRI